MLEIVLYQLSKISNILLLFLVIIILSFLVLYFITKKSKISQNDIKIYGMFVDLRSRDIIMLSAITIRTFLMIVCSCKYIKEIIIYLLMIMIASLVYIIFKFSLKSAVFETINMIAQIFSIYLINILSGYLIEVENDIYVNAIKIFLMIFIIMYAIYSFLRNFEEIITRNKKDRRKMDEKR